MTYAQFLVVFLLLPILVLAAVLWRQVRRPQGIALALVCLLAFVYTTPWDNYAAYHRLWTFDARFVLGPPFWFGYLPLEEYLFYFGEAIFVCLVLIGLGRVPALAPRPETESGLTPRPPSLIRSFVAGKGVPDTEGPNENVPPSESPRAPGTPFPATKERIREGGRGVRPEKN